MQQVLQEHRSGETVVRSVPIPRCSPGGVLVRNSFSAISSGTERARVRLSQKSLLGKAHERPDLVREVVARARRDGVKATMHAVQRRLSQEVAVGYSCAGTVVEVGGRARDLQPGDLVACAGATASHAEFVTVPANLCVRVPDGVPLQSAAITTIGAVALHAIRLAEVDVGSRVAVIGCGLVGQLALRLLRAAGSETFALDIDPRRVDQARAGGADHASMIHPDVAQEVRARTAGVDAVIVAAAAASNLPLLLAADVARDRAAIVLVGAVPIDFPRAAMYDKELRFRVSRSYGPGRYDAEYEERGLDYPIGYVRWTERRNMEAVLRLQAQGLVSLDDLVEVVPAQDAPTAYARLAGNGQTPPRGALVLAYGDGNDAAAGVNGGPVAMPQTAVEVVTPHNGTAGRPAAKVGTGRSQVRIGLIGPGGFAGRVLIPALEEAGAKLVSVGGGTGPSAAAAGRNGGFQRVAEDASAVIADPEVDGVVIATRHVDHAALVIEALSAGKHVFCEKPLALNSDELDAVMQAERKAPGTLLVGFNRRFSPLLHEMASFLDTPGEPMILSYRVSAGRLPEDHWTHDIAQGGGRILGEACHFVDALTFITGHPVAEVYATAPGSASRALQADDDLVVSMRFADRSVASLLYVAAGSPRVAKERLEGFCGSRAVVLEDYRALDLYNGARHDRRRPRAQEKGHRQEISAFLRAVRTGEAPIERSEIASVTLATLAIVESLRTGRTVRLGA